MRKLLTTAAVCGLVVAAAPAHADIDLNLGGYFKGYGSYVDQDSDLATNVRKFDMLRETEIHFTGETVLDNGLTVGFHAEADVDGRDGSNFDVEESYLYTSGAWGRVNLGLEDGAAYLLQVAAPSADENIDGIRQYINPVNYSGSIASLAAAGIIVDQVKFDYANDATRNADKVTYLSPVFSGFQVGASYSPEVTDGHANGLGGNRTKGLFHDAWEGAARYQGNYNNVGITLGGGYTYAKVNKSASTYTGTEKNLEQWNAGANLAISAFNVGGAYTRSNGANTNANDRTWVVGADYTTGPFKLGLNYYNDKADSIGPAIGGTNSLKTNRYSGGVTYTYGPGMTFRGSIGYIDHKAQNASKADATYVLLGTQVNF